MYELIKKDGLAKRGRLHTVHGVIETPVFMNVGTAAAIKGAVATSDLQEIKTQVELESQLIMGSKCRTLFPNSRIIPLRSAIGRKEQKNRHRKVTGDVEARICAIACSTPPEGASRWTMQAIAEELIRLEVVDYITDSTVCNVMKKTKLNRGL